MDRDKANRQREKDLGIRELSPGEQEFVEKYKHLSGHDAEMFTVCVLAVRDEGLRNGWIEGTPNDLFVSDTLTRVHMGNLQRDNGFYTFIMKLSGDIATARRKSTTYKTQKDYWQFKYDLLTTTQGKIYRFWEFSI